MISFACYTRRSVLTALLSVALLSLQGCVTTIEGQQQIDKSKALEAQVQLGMTYLKQNKREGAMRSFTRALELDDDSAEAYLGMALLHQLNGETEESERNFKKALRGRIGFSKASIQFSYGRFLYEQNRYEDALEQFEQAASDFAYPNRALALMNVGRSALKIGNKVRAKGAFEHSLNLNSSIAQSALELADMSFQERDYTNAKKYLDKFSNITRHVPRSLWLGIRIERIFGNKDKEASYALALKNLYPYSQEYLDYKRFLEQN